MKNFKIKTNIILLFLIISSYFLTPSIGFTLSDKTVVYSNQNSSGTASTQIKESKLTNSEDFSANNPQLNKINFNNWEEMTQTLDRNGNGIDDQFEFNLETISCEQIRIIIQFPDRYDYNEALLLFEEEGVVRHEYKEATNGFAGNIDYEDFNNFCEQLKQNKIPFFIEEDGIMESNLYYASRSLNLRPYVWNSLGYTGDNDSSIAILDTGIDDYHEFFDNFSDDDFRFKIVGWEDKVSFPQTVEPFDDNGHGSHCAGIAAGMGTPKTDGLGRFVATTSLYEDFFPYAFIDDYSFIIPLSSFNVTEAGEIEIECNFTDFTYESDRSYGRAILYRDTTQIAIVGNNSDNWEQNLTATVSPGIHRLAMQITFDDLDIDGDPYVKDPLIRFRGEIHWPFNPNPLGGGNFWKGVAPDTHLVGVKVLDDSGSGFTSDVKAGVDWVIANKLNYNITVMSLSLGSSSIVSTLADSLNQAVDEGIVTIVAAGNSGPGGNNVDFPGIVDKVITVGATNYKDEIAYYSSQGGTYYSTSKPDIVAPGGSIYDLTMFSADTDDNDAEGNFTNDHYADDLQPAQGTSMATPIVAGAANLLVQAMGGGNNWDWTSNSKSLMVKSLLLMTATETYGLRRENYEDYSPTLNRGGKDVHEGYGRINIDAAIEAWTNNLTKSSANSINISVWLNTSQYNPYGKHAYAGYVNLKNNENVVFNLSVPDGADYDLYFYNNISDEYGQPDLIASSRSSAKGGNEIIDYTVDHAGKFFLVVKAIGYGIPSDDDDDDDKKKTVTTIDLLPILIIIGIIALLAIVFVIILYKKGRKDSTNDFSPEY